MGRSRFASIAAFHVALLGVLAALVATSLLDEEEEFDFDEDSEPLVPTKLAPHEDRYLQAIHARLHGYQRQARRRRRRHAAMLWPAVLSAAAVPVAVAGNLPGVVIASLGGLAAALQAATQSLHDEAIALESHAAASELSRNLRRLSYELDACFTPAQHERVFRSFVDSTEANLKATVSSSLERLRQAGA